MRIPLKFQHFLLQKPNKPLFLSHGHLDEYYATQLLNLINEGADYISDPALIEWFTEIASNPRLTEVLINQLQDYHFTDATLEKIVVA